MLSKAQFELLILIIALNISTSVVILTVTGLSIVIDNMNNMNSTKNWGSNSCDPEELTISAQQMAFAMLL